MNFGKNKFRKIKIKILILLHPRSKTFHLKVGWGTGVRGDDSADLLKNKIR